MKNKRTVYPSFLFASILTCLIRVLRAFRVGVVYLPSQPPLVNFLKGLTRKWERKIDPVIFSCYFFGNAKTVRYDFLTIRSFFKKSMQNSFENCINCKFLVLTRAFWRVFSLFRGLSITRKAYNGKGLRVFCYITSCFRKRPIFPKKKGVSVLPYILKN